jgi:hypothetical protein
VQTLFAELTKGDERIAPSLRLFLSSAYNLKRLADYETGPGSEVSAERATEATRTAHQFVACIAGLLPPNDQPTPEPKPRSR